VVKLDQVPGTDNVLCLLERPLKHNRKPHVPLLVNHGVAGLFECKLSVVSLDEWFGVTLHAHGKAHASFHADQHFIFGADVHVAVGLFVVEDDEVALLHLVAVHPELLACNHFEQTLFVHLVVHVNAAGAHVLDDLRVVRAQILRRVRVLEDHRFTLEQVLAVFERDHGDVHLFLLLSTLEEQVQFLFFFLFVFFGRRGSYGRFGFS